MTRSAPVAEGRLIGGRLLLRRATAAVSTAAHGQREGRAADDPRLWICLIDPSLLHDRERRPRLVLRRALPGDRPQLVGARREALRRERRDAGDPAVRRRARPAPATSGRRRSSPARTRWSGSAASVIALSGYRTTKAEIWLLAAFEIGVARLGAIRIGPLRNGSSTASGWSLGLVDALHHRDRADVDARRLREHAQRQLADADLVGRLIADDRRQRVATGAEPELALEDDVAALQRRQVGSSGPSSGYVLLRRSTMVPAASLTSAIT